jgi:hypothetical protein
MNIYDEFCRKQHSILFATDIAPRGLDFPNVNWVLQVDCLVDGKRHLIYEKSIVYKKNNLFNWFMRLCR